MRKRLTPAQVEELMGISKRLEAATPSVRSTEIITTCALFIEDMPVLFSHQPDDCDFSAWMPYLRPEYRSVCRIGAWTGTFPLTGAAFDRSLALLDAVFDCDTAPPGMFPSKRPLAREARRV